jgi:hypothetical protein
MPTRVARGYNFRLKIPIWVNFGGTCNGRWDILWSFGQFSSHLVYFMVFWYILWPFLMFYKEKSCNSDAHMRQDTRQTNMAFFVLPMSGASPQLLKACLHETQILGQTTQSVGQRNLSDDKKLKLFNFCHPMQNSCHPTQMCVVRPKICVSCKHPLSGWSGLHPHPIF